MKTNIICIIAVLLTICLLCSCTVNAETLIDEKTMKPEAAIKRVKVNCSAPVSSCYENEYMCFCKYIEKFSTYEMTGKCITFENIDSVDDLIVDVENVWTELYGETVLECQKPYIVINDLAGGMWMIKGDAKKTEDDEEIVNAIVKDTGELLAVWQG